MTLPVAFYRAPAIVLRFDDGKQVYQPLFPNNTLDIALDENI